nr:desmoplakin [Darna trima granulovirus]
MILTRYKGVDVTPHTFNNLIKTITDQRCISNTSSSKTEFESKIRDIILAFAPNLRKISSNMTTEHLLINSLKLSDKKEITHTYNYNGWKKRQSDNSDDSASAEIDDRLLLYEDLKNASEQDEWNEKLIFNILEKIGGKNNKRYVKKIKKKYNHHMYLSCKKPSVSIDKKNYDDDEDIGNLIAALTHVVGKKTSIKKYTHAVCDVEQNIQSTRQKLQSTEEKLCMVEKELYESKNLYTFKEIELNRENAQLKINQEALNRNIENLSEKLTNANDIISQNVIELAKLGADLGERDSQLEEATIEKYELKKQISLLEKNYVCTDEENTELMKDKSKLQSKINDLEERLKISLDNNRKYENKCYDLINQKSKDSDSLSSAYELLKQQHDAILNEKNTLSEMLSKTSQSLNDVNKKYDVETKQLGDQIEYKNKQIESLEREMATCKARIIDNETKYHKNLDDNLNSLFVSNSELEKLKCKINDLTIKNNNLMDENNNFRLMYEEGCEIIKKNSEIQSEYKKLQAHLDRVQEEHKKNIDDYERKIKTISDQCEQIVTEKELDCEKKIYIEREKERERLEKHLLEKMDNMKKTYDESYKNKFQTELFLIKEQLDQCNLDIQKKQANIINLEEKTLTLDEQKPSTHKRKNDTIMSKLIRPNKKLYRKSAHVAPIVNSSFVSDI